MKVTEKEPKEVPGNHLKSIGIVPKKYRERTGKVPGKYQEIIGKVTPCSLK